MLHQVLADRARALASVDSRWLAGLLAVGVAGTTAAFAPLPTAQAHMAAVTLFCIVLWIATPVPPWFTGVVGLGLVGVRFSPSLALGGFAEPVVWLVAFGLVIGEAIDRTGVTAAIERPVLRWAAPTAVHPGAGRLDPVVVYRRLLVALSAFGLVFALVVPSSLVRVLVLAPMLVDLGRRFESRAARRGLLFGPLFATFYGGLGVLTAFLPNVVVTGIAETTANVSITWSAWLTTMFPVMGLGRAVLVVAVVYWRYRPAPDTHVSLAAPSSSGPSSRRRRTAMILLVGVAIWATDAVHGLHPMFGALVVAGLLVAPGVGTVPLETVEEVDFTLLFFLGAVFAVAAGLSETGLTEVAAQGLLALVPPGASPPVALAAVFAVSLALVGLVEGVATASVLTPVLVSFAGEAGLPVTTVVQVEAVALGTLFFPYQSVVLVALLGYEPVEAGELIRLTALLSLGTILVLVPLQFLAFGLL